MKNAAYIGGVLGLALLVALVVRADFSAMMHTLDSGGWPLLWLSVVTLAVSVALPLLGPKTPLVSL